MSDGCPDALRDHSPAQLLQMLWGEQLQLNTHELEHTEFSSSEELMFVGFRVGPLVCSRTPGVWCQMLHLLILALSDLTLGIVISWLVVLDIVSCICLNLRTACGGLAFGSSLDFSRFKLSGVIFLLLASFLSGRLPLSASLQPPLGSPRCQPPPVPPPRAPLPERPSARPRHGIVDE